MNSSLSLKRLHHHTPSITLDVAHHNCERSQNKRPSGLHAATVSVADTQKPRLKRKVRVAEANTDARSA